MKYIAIFSVFVLLAVAVGTGALLMTANVTVESMGAIATEAADQLPIFESLQDQMSRQEVLGTAYTTTPLGAPEEYQFITYTLRLKNSTFLPADMVELQVTPMEGDVLQMADTTPRKLNAHTTGDISATILTRKGMHATREIHLTYYIWGLPFFTKTVYGQ